MPYTGNTYGLPAGTTVTTGTPVASVPYNAFVADIEDAQNHVRPIVAGGTGASTASGARTALGGLATLAGTETLSNKTLAGVTISANVVMSATDARILSDTTDGSDTKSFYLTAGGAVSGTRGAYVGMHGNEYASNPGRLTLAAGTTGYVHVSGSLYAANVVSDTTATTENVNIDLATGQLRRVTSSLDYKTDVEPVEISYSLAAVRGLSPIYYRSTCAGDNQEWSWWGFAAEEAAEIDPRLVIWQRPKKTVTVTRQVPVTATRPRRQVDIIDGKAVVTTIEDGETYEVVDLLPMVDQDGSPILDAAGAQAMYPVPRMEDISVEIEVDDLDAPLVPGGFAYGRLPVHHHMIINDLLDRVAALEADGGEPD